MSRANLTDAMYTALTTDEVRAEFLLHLDYSGGPVRLWTGVKDQVWDGSTWNGTGDFQGLSGIQEVSELKAVGTQIALSGIPATYISLALNENIRDRVMSIRLACINSSDSSIVADPLVIFSGYMDTQEISEREETAMVMVNGESKLINIGRTKKMMFTHEDQRLISTGDLGLEYVNGLANEPMVWGI